MKAYIVRNVDSLNDAIEKLENALLRRRIHFLRVKYNNNRVRITVLDLGKREARIEDIEFTPVFAGEGAIRFYETGKSRR